MESAVTLDTLSLAELAQRCHAETKKFYQNVEHDPRYCYELLRRAFVLAQAEREQAWDLVYQQYKAQVFRWALHHPQFKASGEETDDIVHAVFERLYRVLTPDKFNQFPNLASILRYMQMCVHSVVIDVVRKNRLRGSLEESLDEDETQMLRAVLIAEPADPNPDRRRFWDTASRKLKDDKERLVVKASYGWAMKPGEILEAYAGSFTDIDEIYRIKQNILERLKRDPDLREFWTDH
jgi:DNA-directed RNA polymerase specialized sigma24 family protein